jgi:hypothetical protein
MPYLPAPEYNVGDIVRIRSDDVGMFDWMTPSVRCEVTELYKGCCGSGYLVRVRNLDTNQLEGEYDSFFFEKETQTMKTPYYTNENRTMLPVQECEVEKLQIGDRFKNRDTKQQVYLIGNVNGVVGRNNGLLVTDDSLPHVVNSVSCIDWLDYIPIGKSALRLRPLIAEPVKTTENKLRELFTNEKHPFSYLCYDIQNLNSLLKNGKGTLYYSDLADLRDTMEWRPFTELVFKVYAEVMLPPCAYRET